MTTFHQLLRDGAKAHGARPAILFEELTVGYEELLSRVESVANGFRALGVSEAGRLAIVMENSFECILAWLGSSVVGCTDVPINPQYRGDLLLYLLRDSETNAVVCDADYLGQVLEVAGRLPALELIVVHGEPKAPVAAAPSRIRIARLGDCMASAPGAPMVEGAAERVLLYTSGTTGPSKGVIHTQASCLVLSRYNAEMLAYEAKDRLLNFFPLYHQNARYTGVIPALCTGASIRMERKFSSSSFWRTVAADGTTAFNYLGSVLRLILNVTPPDFGPHSHTLRKAFGAGAPPLAWEQCKNRLGIHLAETYGLTEAPMATINTWVGGRQAPLGSAGRASDLFEVAVVDEKDNLLKAGEVGEIVMRPRIPDAMMVGYQNKDEATVRAFRNLWFHSGDRGRLAEDGALYFEERGKDAIRRRGENISAWEVESILDQHPDVLESAVYGVASDEADEDVAAALVLRRADASLAAILQFAEERLPRYAVPTLLRVMKDLPRTPTAKVQKAELRSAGRAGCVTGAEVRSGKA